MNKMTDCVVWLARWLCRLADQPLTLFLRDALDSVAGL
jgi:hypothetical protein